MSSFAEWITETMEHPELRDLCIQGTQSVYSDCGNGWVRREPPGAYTLESDLKPWLLDLLRRLEKSWDAAHPFIDATLGDLRFHIVFPPAAAEPLISIRKSHTRPPGSLNHWHAEAWSRLCQAVQQKQNILIAGPTGSGKTTLLRDLFTHGCQPNERVLALEETPELRLPLPHFVSLLARPANSDGFGEVTLRTLLRESLRMRPDRILIGEIRGNEVVDYLQSLFLGHTGSASTIHASNAREALFRLELLTQLAAPHLQAHTLRPWIASSLHWVAVLAPPRPKVPPQILELAHIEGHEGHTICLRTVLGSEHGRTLSATPAMEPKAPFAQHSFF